jgi:hypothetical protein
MKFPTDPQKRNNWIAFFVIVSLPVCCGLAIAGTCLVPPNPENAINRNIVEVETSAEEMGLTGTVLHETDSSEVVAIDLATGVAKTVFQSKGEFRIHALEGPNLNGVAIVVENDFMLKRHRLIRLNLAQGTQETIWDRPGDALWESAIGEQMSLAESKNMLVVYSGGGGTQLSDPPAYMTTGQLILLDLDSKIESFVASPAFEGCSAISDDASTIWFAKSIPRDAAKKLPGGFAVTNGRGPVCGIYEWRASKVRPIAAGFYIQNFVKPNSTMISGNETASFVLNLTTAAVSDLLLPDYISGIEEWLPDDTVLASCPQSDPSKVVFVGDNFSRGKQALDRIVAINPAKGQIHTVVQTFDVAFDKWSYGEWSATK